MQTDGDKVASWSWEITDLGSLDEAPPEEARAFKDHYATRYGLTHPGLNFFLDNGWPGPLKRYRLYGQNGSSNGRAKSHATDGGEAGWMPSSYFWGVYYPSIGFQSYIARQVRGWQEDGFTKSQVHELYAVALLNVGPFGMEIIANGLENFDWRTPQQPVEFPPGWKADPGAFDSGLDFSRSDLQPRELAKLEDWYVRVEGEIPAYVRFWGKHRPELLKAYRSRFENALHELPKQVMPTMLLHHNVARGCPEGIRESVLLAKGFGMSRAQTMQIVAAATIYNGAGVVDEAAGDIFQAWAA